jgi:hypothetical protein
MTRTAQPLRTEQPVANAAKAGSRTLAAILHWLARPASSHQPG